MNKDKPKRIIDSINEGAVFVPSKSRFNTLSTPRLLRMSHKKFFDSKTTYHIVLITKEHYQELLEEVAE